MESTLPDSLSDLGPQLTRLQQAQTSVQAAARPRTIASTLSKSADACIAAA